ncbi:DUF551 domain-containing protein [Raoultella ornithinolytica]|uniref:DUF551 domain-containing protein n=1 Tax=Raoultella ornithinolytica TaxID=54291 RepID=UPI00388F42B3
MTRKLTREWLQHQISAIEAVGITDSNTLAAFKLALAAMDSELVGTLSVRAMSYSGKKIGTQFGFTHSDAAMKVPEGDYPLYRHEQAAPLVPDNRAITQHFDTIALETAREILCDVNRRHELLGGDVQLLSRIQCRIDEACRAVMLQAVPLTNEGDIALHNYRTALEGIGHIRLTLEETFGGLHGTHVEPDVLIECKTICDAIYAAYSGSSPVIPDGKSVTASTGIQVIPDGYVMVPKEPTPEILATITEAIRAMRGSAATYARVLAAAQHDTPALNSLQSVDSVAGKWIPVSERMPEDRISVILWDAEIGEVTSGHYSHKTQTFYHCGDAIENEITHWMPPPCAPQEVK